MLTNRRIQRWESAVRQQAYNNARALAVAIVAGTAWAPPPYDLGIVLEPSEIVWHRCPGTYRWRGTDSWIEQPSSRRGRRTISREVNARRMYSLGTTEWLVTNHRIVTRAPDGQVASIYWATLSGLTVDLASERVVFDGPAGYHGELYGPAIAPIAVAAVAVCHGRRALVEHPGLATIRGGPSPRNSRRTRLTWIRAVVAAE